MSTYILKITEDYKDTSIAKYDNCSVEIMKYHDGVFRFKQQKRKEPTLRGHCKLEHLDNLLETDFPFVEDHY